MIVFTFDNETHEVGGELKPRPVWWIGMTDVIDEDVEHQDEILEQLDAEWAFNL